MKKIIAAFMLLCPLYLCAQNKSNMQKSFDDFLKNTNQSFASFQNSVNTNFASFQDSLNTAFAENLKRQWKEFKVFAPIQRPIKPSPVKPPIADAERKTTPHEIQIEEVISDIPESKSNDTAKQIMVINENSQTEIEIMDIELWKSTCKIPYAKGIEKIKLKSIDGNSISEFWTSIDMTSSKKTVNKIIEITNTCALNDYGILMLCKELSDKIFPPSNNKKNESVVFLIYLLNQLSLDAKIIRINDSLQPVFASEQMIYDIFSTEINDKKYFLLFPHDIPTSMSSYDANFSQDVRNFDFNIYQPLNIGTAVVEKSMQIKKLNKTVNLVYSESSIEYYKTYPQTEITVHANAAVSNLFRKSVINQFKPLLAGNSEYDAVGILLNFMHFAFEYENDTLQFGYEKWNFCEENLYYPYNDCEDRAVLFSYLVRELLHLDVVLLEFSDHLSTAVKFNYPVEGDFLTITGEKYIICDPTYLNASVGMNPPEHNAEKTRVFLTKKL
jgi:hypothetical protein